MAIGAALKVNGIIIVGLAIGVGIQIFALIYGKGLGCKLYERSKYKQQHKDRWHAFHMDRRTGTNKRNDQKGCEVYPNYFRPCSARSDGCNASTTCYVEHMLTMTNTSARIK